MKQAFVLLLALTATAVKGEDLGRFLQQMPPPVISPGPGNNMTNGTQPPMNGTQPPKNKEIPKSYGDNVTIPFNASLGCGACLRANYIYCIPGAEGSDPSTWGTNKAVCCKDKNSCPAISNKTFNCSSKYSST